VAMSLMRHTSLVGQELTVAACSGPHWWDLKVRMTS
jgi:hypothetical protein